jgi:hypothetical protein
MASSFMDEIAAVEGHTVPMSIYDEFVELLSRASSTTT